MPFIFLTAVGDRDSQLKARRMGADDYVVKPIDFEILSTIIKGRLAKVARTENGSRRIDLGNREVECLTWAARRKLNVATRIQAVVAAVSGRLIEP